MPADWNDYQFLLALSREGSVAKAARALKVDQSTASRRLAALESAVGKKLFTRSADGAQLTPEGQLVARAAETMAAAVASLERQLSADHSPQGTVRIATTEGFSSWLTPAVAALRGRYPELEVQVLTQARAHDLLRGEADVALRMFKPSEPDLVARKVGTVGWSIYGSDAYLAHRGAVTDLETLSGHDVVGYDDNLGRIPGAQWLHEHAKGARVAFRGDGVSRVASAIGHGLGVGVIPCFVAAFTPGLRRLTPAVITENEAWVVVHPDLKDAPRVRVVLDQLATLFERDAQLFSGLP